MASVDLAVLKCIVGVTLAAMSTAGAVLPRLARGMDPQSCHRWLPFANCLSAGLLIGAGLLHFFTESTSVLADSTGEKDCGEAAEAALRRSCMCMLGGFFASLAIDRIIVRNYAPAGASHGHSHDISLGHSRDSHHSDASSEEGARDGGQSGWTTTLILGCLLGFHAALEGVSVGLETSQSALRNGFTPLAIHKFFDGLLLGIQAAKGTVPSSPKTEGAAVMRRSGDDETAVDMNAVAKGRSCVETIRAEAQFVAGSLAWSAITPFVMLVVAVASMWTANTAPSAAGRASRFPVSAQAQSFGAGSFLYVAMMEVLPAEFPATSAGPKGRARVATRSVGATEPFVKLASVCIGIALVVLIESAHHHHD